MKKLLTTSMALALLLPVVPGWAGDEGKSAMCDENPAVCAQMMKKKFSERGWVGINMEHDKESGDVVITNVVPSSPAARAGFEVGDVLRGLNGVDYTEANEKQLEAEYASFRPGNEATFTVQREGKTIDIEVQLEQIPEAIMAQWIGQHVLYYHAHQAAVAEVDSETADESP